MPADPLTIYIPPNEYGIKPGSHNLAKLIRHYVDHPLVIMFLADLLDQFHKLNTPEKVNT